MKKMFYLYIVAFYSDDDVKSHIHSKIECVIITDDISDLKGKKFQNNKRLIKEIKTKYKIHDFYIDEESITECDYVLN